MTQQYDNVYAEASQGQTVLNQGLYETSTTQKYDLGHIIRLNDGRTFVYAMNGANTISAGQVLQTKADMYKNASISALGAVSGKALTVGDGTFYVTASAALVSALNVGLNTAGTLPANAAAGGFVYVSDSGGAAPGSQYKIKSHAALAASGSLALNLWDPIRYAETTTAMDDAISVAGNPYRGVQPHAISGSATGYPVGVAPIDVTASVIESTRYYFWMQTWGPCAIHHSGPNTADTLAAGQMVVPSSTTVGAIQCPVVLAQATSAVVAATPPVIGYSMGVVASGKVLDYVPVFLQIQA